VLSYLDHNQTDWFTNGLKLRLGNCSKVFFWSDNWLGSACFMQVFLHLYVLVEGRNCSVEDVGYWSEGVWHWNLSWRCKLLDGISPNVRPRISGFGCWIW
jgi:hypothetical protein